MGVKQKIIMQGRTYHLFTHLTNLMRKTYGFAMVGKQLYCTPISKKVIRVVSNDKGVTYTFNNIKKAVRSLMLFNNHGIHAYLTINNKIIART